MIVGEQRTEVSSEQTRTALSITSSRTTPPRKGQQSFLMHSNARSYGIDMNMHIRNVREKKPKKARLRGRRRALRKLHTGTDSSDCGYTRAITGHDYGSMFD